MTPWLRTPRIRRALALSAVVLATGGLVLTRSSASAFVPQGTLIAGKNASSFTGPGAHGQIALSQGSILAGSTTTVYADVRLVADPSERGKQRAPLAMAVVLDTSGSMEGEKIADARRSVLRLIADMNDDDQISVVRYSDSAELIQPLARLGSVRSSLRAAIEGLQAGGGTNIPAGLAEGIRALSGSVDGRVRRVVLVSDGLDGARMQSESLARSSSASGVTVSSLGIGLDFDERYMGGVAQSGHGNFAFVKDGAALASFLHRELEETSSTTIENARVHLELPPGVRFVSATGADAVPQGSGVDLVIGSLFGGDERRVIVELAASGSEASSFAIGADASWRLVGGSDTTIRATDLRLVTTTQMAQVEASRDGAVLANATSVVVSKRQLEAASAYAAGDTTRAAQITEQNERALSSAMAFAPAPVAKNLEEQKTQYAAARESFARVAPSSDKGKAVAKSAAAKDIGNLSRQGF